jgi:hypothetical protein
MKFEPMNPAPPVTRMASFILISYVLANNRLRVPAGEGEAKAF